MLIRKLRLYRIIWDLFHPADSRKVYRDQPFKVRKQTLFLEHKILAMRTLLTCTLGYCQALLWCHAWKLQLVLLVCLWEGSNSSSCLTLRGQRLLLRVGSGQPRSSVHVHHGHPCLGCSGFLCPESLGHWGKQESLVAYLSGSTTRDSFLTFRKALTAELSRRSIVSMPTTLG